MKHKLAPRLKKVEAPPVLLRTWIVRCLIGDTLVKTISLSTERDAHSFAGHWRGQNEQHYATVEVVTQQRRLR
jgi:hypothetical protein